jgi:hypothetical protein
MSTQSARKSTEAPRFDAHGNRIEVIDFPGFGQTHIAVRKDGEAIIDIAMIRMIAAAAEALVSQHGQASYNWGYSEGMLESSEPFVGTPPRGRVEFTSPPAPFASCGGSYTSSGNKIEDVSFPAVSIGFPVRKSGHAVIGIGELRFIAESTEEKLTEYGVECHRKGVLDGTLDRLDADQ